MPDELARWAASRAPELLAPGAGVAVAATPAGLVQAVVRVMVPQEGPRASGKIIRWNRVQTGELALCYMSTVRFAEDAFWTGERLRQEYLDLLPAATLSRCPHSGEAVTVPIDTFDAFAKTGAPVEAIQYGDRAACTRYAKAMVELDGRHQPRARSRD